LQATSDTTTADAEQHTAKAELEKKMRAKLGDAMYEKLQASASAPVLVTASQDLATSSEAGGEGDP